MSAPEKPKPKKAQARPIFLIVRTMVHPDTGELQKCLVASNEGSRVEMKRRKFTEGKRLKAELTVPRNVKFWRKAHVLAELCMKHVDAFEGLGQHESLKKLQVNANVECDTIVIPFPDNPIRYRVARTLAFDSMPEDTFNTVYDTIVDYIKRRYFPEWDEGQMQELIDLTDREMNWQ